MSARKKSKNSKKQSGKTIAAKAAMLVLTAIYPFFMVILTGLGVVYNHKSYGTAITCYGALLIVSGALITTAAVLCLFRGEKANKAALAADTAGFLLCMAMLHKLASHADSAGWTGTVGKYRNIPVADTYREHILPVILPFLLILVISAVQIINPGCEKKKDK